MNARYFALIPAAGTGTRMGGGIPKQYQPLAEKPIIYWTVQPFLSLEYLEKIFIVVRENDSFIDEIFPYSNEKISILRCGGETRRDSVLNGLNAISSQVKSEDWIMVHDAARPGLTADLVDKLRDEVTGKDGGLLALPVRDTVKRADNDIVKTLPREGLWLAQTPQMFRYAQLRNALENYADATDEASAVENTGGKPVLVEGHLCNTKITTPSDKVLVEMFLKERK